ncbi:copper transporter [Psychrosphaera saromensis]|nr:copper transporter [Psychrosphaera saromensis]GLQ14299.1 copper transporter [Psychrosphaera saromensis]
MNLSFGSMFMTITVDAQDLSGTNSSSTNSSKTINTNVKSVLTFEMAIKTAQKNDPWLSGNAHQQQALKLMGQASNSLPDPKVSFGLANLPVGGFDFSQVAMTQAQIGISQVFPRGDTLALKSQQYKTQSEAFPYQRQDREAKVAVTVGRLWLEAYRAQQSITLIENNRALFEQLADVAQANYSSALARTRQQDIVRAQLELTRLEERLDKLRQQKSQSEGMLFQWLINFADTANTTTADMNFYMDLYNVDFGEQLPQIDLHRFDLLDAEFSQQHQQHHQQQQQQMQSSQRVDSQRVRTSTLIQRFEYHPSVQAINKKITATKTQVHIAEQKYKPQWGVSASYGYRDDAPSSITGAAGIERDDLFSIGISFDLPIFTENKQDKEVQSAISKTEAVKTEKLLLLRELLSAYSNISARLDGVKRRQSLYKSKLLPQIHDNAEATLSAYNNDDGDFLEVVRSRIAVLNTEIDELNLDVDEQQLNLELNYMFIGNNVTAGDK